MCQSNDTCNFSPGGGFSQFYSAPSYQTNLVESYFTAVNNTNKAPVAGYARYGRGFPDVSLAGSRFLTLIGNEYYLVSGTSASCPVVAGFLSNINAARMKIGKGSLGWVNPALYANYASFTNDITSGHNLCVSTGQCCSQGFHAVSGWDPASGLGSLNYGLLASTLVKLGNEVNGLLYAPSLNPTAKPTSKPSAAPTNSPTKTPTARPSTKPTVTPTIKGSPSSSPTASPTSKPTVTPSAAPTTSTPSIAPSATPSDRPSVSPSSSPTASPTSEPTVTPSAAPTTSTPSLSPMSLPSTNFVVTRTPSARALPRRPSSRPSVMWKYVPSYRPSIRKAQSPMKCN